MATRKLLAPDRLPDLGITIGDDQRAKLEQEGKFPRRVQVTARTHAYVEDEIVEYVTEKIAARDRAAPGCDTRSP